MSKTFAYIRVSSKDQPENRQLDSLQGLTIDEIIIEKASGKNFIGRAKYQEMKSKLRAGDLVIVKSIDRFGRPTPEIPKDFIRCYELYKQGLIKVKDVISMCNIKRSTFCKNRSIKFT